MLNQVMDFEVIDPRNDPSSVPQDGVEAGILSGANDVFLLGKLVCNGGNRN